MNSKRKSPFEINILKILLAIMLLQFTSCNTTEPSSPEKPKAIELKEITKSCTETFLTVSVKDTVLPANIKIKRDGKEIMNYYQITSDTTIIDTGMTAGKTYNYQAIVELSGKAEQSEILPVRTLDTTSSNFTWKKYTFGEHSSSIINDVAIINENNIWAVGEIYMNDSSGNPDPHAYNAVHWDGQKWELKRIYYYGNCSAVKYPPLYAILVLSKNNIIITNGGSVGWYDGENVKLDCGVNSLLNGAISKIRGTSNNDLYVVGRNGTIAYYDGTSWRKIESGTNLTIHNIYGDVNPFTGESEIICCGSTTQSKNSEIIRIKKDLSAEKINAHNIYYAFGIWFKSGIRYYITGNGLYESKYRYKTEWVDLNKGRKITSNFMNGIEGNGLNDIFVSGAFGEILHYNGIKWKSLKNEQTTLINGSYFSICTKKNIVVAVGYDRNKAVILFGKR